MGKYQNTLIEMLSQHPSYEFSSIPKPSKDDYTSSVFSSDIYDVYKSLGGIQSDYPTGFGKWDFIFNNIIVELDEFLHFNRYRKKTLESNLYQQLPTFPFAKYISFSERYEDNCLKAGSYGGKWSNNSTEKQFGNSNKPGIYLETVLHDGSKGLSMIS